MPLQAKPLSFSFTHLHIFCCHARIIARRVQQPDQQEKCGLKIEQKTYVEDCLSTAHLRVKTKTLCICTSLLVIMYFHAKLICAL